MITFEHENCGAPCTVPELQARSGQPVIILRELGDDERDAEVGRMFEIGFEDGFTAQAFEDELSGIVDYWEGE